MSSPFDARQAETPLFDALVEASRKHGPKKLILEDQERNPIAYQDLIRASFALGRKIAGFTASFTAAASLSGTLPAGGA